MPPYDRRTPRKTERDIPMSNDPSRGWQPIESAPKDREILVYTRPWGSIIALLSAEFGEWLSRMQVPVSIKEDEELPTHWQPLPEPPAGLDARERDSEGSSYAAPLSA